MSVQAPTSVTRSCRWQFEWNRPKRMGWPTIENKRVFGSGGTMAPARIRVVVRRTEDSSPEIELITMRGRWANSARHFMWTRLDHNGSTGGLCVPAPDWVMELAAEALRLTEAEVSP